MKIAAKDLLIGAHTSAAGGVYNALLQGQKIGATTIQLFTNNQRQWTARPISDETVLRWKETLKETGLKEIMSHDSYLINLGSPTSENLQKSLNAFRLEIERCLTLGVHYLNFHPGAALDGGEEACLERIVSSLLSFEDLLESGKLRLLLEATAGQGSSLGFRFEQLQFILDRVKKKVPVGICIDTCHIFAAGYDIRTEESFGKVLEEFDQTVGLSNLYAFHVNDSLKPLGSRVDRHASLGKGLIGIETFKFLMRDARTRNIPKYLETPNPDLWKEEIQLLREFAER